VGDKVAAVGHGAGMRWVLMLFVILAAAMGGEARAVVVTGRVVVSERGGKAETVEKWAETLRVESERAPRVAALEVQKAAGLMDDGPLALWFPGGLAVARSDCGDRQAEFSDGTLSLLLARGVDIGGGTRGLLWTARRETVSAETGSAVTLRFNRYNSRGDVVGQSDAAGVTTWAATYQADGRRTGEIGTNLNPKHATGRVRELGVNRDRHRACTKEEDPTGLLNEGFRYRDMETGTFISRDPLGHVDGPNVYCYVRQNPWTAWDPEGLWGIGDSNGPVLDYLWDLGGGVVDGGIEAVEGMGHAVAHPINTATAVKDGVLAVRDGIGELSSALDAGHVTWGEIGTAYGDGLAEVASDPAKVGKIVGSSAVSLGAGKAAAVGGKLAMAAALQTNTARTVAVSAVLATAELAPVASGAARGGAIAAQVGAGFANGAKQAAKTPLGPVQGPSPQIHTGAQGKHIPGHNNYQPGKSPLTADPSELGRQAGTGQQVGKVEVGLPGSKERVDFGSQIGEHIDPVTGASSPTTSGIIHYGGKGIHIVPARP
jgi:RHS repeat-associated protein